MIAALTRNPTLYSPRTHAGEALGRRNYILGRMAAEHMISPQMAAEAKSRPIALKPLTHEDTEIAPHFIEWVRESLATRYSTDEIWRKGMQVYTTLNIRMQNAARRALREGLRSFDKKHGWRGPIGNVLSMPATSMNTYSHPSWRNPLHTEDVVVGLVKEVDRTEAAVNSSQTSLASPRARLPQAEASLDREKQSYERSKKLWEQKTISQADWEIAQSAYKSAVAEVESAKQTLHGAEFGVKSAEASLKEANENLIKTTIYAPMSGTVSILNVE